MKRQYWNVHLYISSAFFKLDDGPFGSLDEAKIYVERNAGEAGLVIGSWHSDEYGDHFATTEGGVITFLIFEEL